MNDTRSGSDLEARVQKKKRRRVVEDQESESEKEKENAKDLKVIPHIVHLLVGVVVQVTKRRIK